MKTIEFSRLTADDGKSGETHLAKLNTKYLLVVLAYARSK